MKRLVTLLPAAAVMISIIGAKDNDGNIENTIVQLSP